MIKASFSDLRDFNNKKKNKDKKDSIPSDFYKSFIEPDLENENDKDENEDIIEIKQEIIKDKNVESFKNKGIADSFFELNWKSFDPDIIVDFLVASSEILSGMELFEHQKIFIRRIFRSIVLREGADIVGLWSRQSGKTQTVSVAIATLCIIMPKLARIFKELKDYERGFFAGIFAPTEKQAKISYNRVKSIVKSEYCKKFMENPAINVNFLKEGLKWDNGSIVFYGSAKMSSNIEGDTGHLIYIDEAQDIDEEVFSYKINPMRAFTNGTLVLTGLPSTNKFFKTKYNEAKINSSFLPDDRKLLFEFDYRFVCRFNKYYEAFVNNQLKKEGGDSLFFRRNFLLDWDTFKSLGKSFDIEFFINKCCKSYLDFNDYTNGYLVAGLDLAYTGVSVLTIGEIVETDRKQGDFLVKEFILKILDIFKFEKLSTIDLQEQVYLLLSRYDKKHIFTFDNTGGGQYFVETFKNIYRDLSPHIRALNFNKHSKSLLTSLFNDLVNQGKIYFPSSNKARAKESWKLFMKQLSSVELVESDVGIYFNSKNKYMFPDDFLDSFLLCLNSYYDYVNNRGVKFNYSNPDLKPNPLFDEGKSKFKFRFPASIPKKDNDKILGPRKNVDLSNRIIKNLFVNDI
ncbi:MAG: hypothetical protein KatS3mg068_1572 [Candidatus Sericytochromatia bacterium]|nr:MAG: hypothetical protein KatS3mg068_1572 [Candidatus Sericytochromatia bacterium]